MATAVLSAVPRSGVALSLLLLAACRSSSPAITLVGRKDSLENGHPPAPMRVTATPGPSIGAYLAWNGDRLGLAWSDDDAGQYEIFFQAFDRNGRPEREALRVTATPASSLIPAIKAWRSGFALAWGEYEPRGGDGHAEGDRSQIAFTVQP